MCKEDNWPVECDANFRIGKTKCEPCDPGVYGCNCSTPCPNYTYGFLCYETCNCTSDEFCDRQFGCLGNSSISTTSKSLSYTPLNTVYSKRMTGVNSNPFLDKFTMFLLISVVSVVIFSVLCTFLLIRTSKRHYKRELQRMISNITEENSDAEHEYSGYYTMDSMSGARFSSVYNHTERGEYNILSLSQRAYVDDADFSPMTSFHPQNRQLNSETELNDNESLGSVIEAGCLINLFQECEDDLMNDGTESETIAKL